MENLQIAKCQINKCKPVSYRKHLKPQSPFCPLPPPHRRAPRPTFLVMTLMTMVPIQTAALRTGARRLTGAKSSSKFSVAAMPQFRAVAATDAAPAATPFRGLVTQAHRATTATQWKRPAPAPASDVTAPAVSWRQQYQPAEQYGRARNEGGGQVVNGDVIQKKSEDAISLIRRLEALRLVNVGGALAHDASRPTGSESGEISTEEYSAMNRNNRKPRKANHGARPCSRYSRRAKKRKWGNPRR